MTDTYKNESRKDWHDLSKDKPDREQLMLGCLQRIADATESMATEYNRLIRDNTWLRSSRDDYRNDCERLRKQNASLRGVITRMKNKTNSAT
jgi:hypothetical protein